MERCFSTIAIKALDEEQRTIRGVASTPEPDRQLDIVEPMGLRFKNPVSLLWQHRHDSPVGTTLFDRPTRAGITFTAKLPKVGEPGTFKDQVDHAWEAVKHGACRAVSIGFLPLEAEPLPTGGTRFKKAELLELSLVTVPANSGATITEIKAIDARVRAGEVPQATLAGSLWRKVAEAGQAALDLTETSNAYRTANAGIKTALASGNMSTAMFKELCAHIDSLERQLAEPTMKYLGVWKPGRSYPAGSFVTCGGSMWHADRATDFKPGEGHGWTLAVKRGADAR